MSDLTETQALLETFLNDNWTETVIAWDNTPFVEDTTTPYISVQFLPYSNRNITIGGGIHSSLKRTRQRGVLSIDIFTPLQKGSSRAYELADKVMALMNTQNIDGVFTYAGDTRRIGKIDVGWFMIVVDIPFTSDD